MQKQCGAIRSFYTSTKQIVLLFTHIVYVLKILKEKVYELKVSDTNLISDQMWSHTFHQYMTSLMNTLARCLSVFMCFCVYI